MKNFFNAICTIAAISGASYIGLIGFSRYVKATTMQPKAPSSQLVASSNKYNVEQNIRERCERKWGTDYRMIRYCIDTQTEAARSLGY